MLPESTLNELSVCIIAKNEEHNIKQCLDSVRDIASEIIVVDTGSSDSTKLVAELNGAIVYDFKWIDDFSAARNFSFEKATKQLILFIDCDETLLNPLELKGTLQSAKNSTGGWIVNLTSESDQKGGSKDIYQSALLRIVRNHPKIRFSGAVHEQILEPILELDLKIETTQVNLYHSGYNLSPEKMKEKQLRNLKLLEKSLVKSPNDYHNLHHFGKTLLALGEKHRALTELLRAIEVSPKDSAVYPQSLNFASIAAYRIGNKKQAASLAKKSLNIVPEQAFANYVLGEIENDKENWQTSLYYYCQMYKWIKNPSLKSKIIGDYNLPDEQIYFRFGRAKVAMKRYVEAEKDFLKAIDINPNISNSLIGLANINFNRGNLDSARQLLIEASEKDANKNQINKYLNEINIAEKAQSQSSNKSSQNNQSQRSLSSVDDLKNLMRSKTPSKKLDPENSKSLKPLITLSMIVKNEEEMLEDCLKSAVKLVDEIVIVDTGSNDKTIQIAEKYNAQVQHFEWINDFAAARNEALKHSKGDWILYLDADERLKPLDINNLRKMLKNADPNLGAIICTIESDHSSLDGSSELHRGGYPRLFRNLGYPKVHFKGRVHEQISPSIVENNLGMVKSDIVISHEGYNRPREEMEQKLKRNYDLLLKHVNEEPTNGYAWYQLGQTLGQMNIKDKAEEAIHFAIKCKNLGNSVYASAASALSQYAGQKKDYQRALYWAEESLKKAPDQVYGKNLKAYALLFLGRKLEARKLFEESLVLLDSSKGVPQTGFDIMIDKNVILNGLKQAKEK